MSVSNKLLKGFSSERMKKTKIISTYTHVYGYKIKEGIIWQAYIPKYKWSKHFMSEKEYNYPDFIEPLQNVNYKSFHELCKEFTLYFEGYVKSEPTPMLRIIKLFLNLEYVVFGDKQTKYWDEYRNKVLGRNYNLSSWDYLDDSELSR